MAYFWDSWALIVGGGKGVWKPHSERWDPKTIDLVQHPPRRTCDDDPNADGEMPQGVKLETSTGHKFQEIVEDKQSMPRRENLNWNDFEEHGNSSGCPGSVKLAAREFRERWKARNGSKGQEPGKTNSSRRF